MIAATVALLDACVLIPMPLADTLLRLAESPRLYEPRWSKHIMDEVSRNLVAKIGLTAEQAAWREGQIREYFPESWVSGFEGSISSMRNQEKDRHVLAAALHSGAKVIVTFNEKDFPDSILGPVGLRTQNPSDFLCGLYDLAPKVVARQLAVQAAQTRGTLSELLLRLKVNAPAFVQYFCERQGIDLG